MVNYDAARSAIEVQLAAMPSAFPGDSWLILNEHTIERDWGWVFYYDSKLHHETDDFRFAIAGNAPFIVRRSDGAVLPTGTAESVEKYIQDFEMDGRLP